MGNRWVAGLDLGQARDFSAFAALEQTAIDGTSAYAVRHLERFPLGTPYTAVVARVAEILSRPPLAGGGLAVDETGVGRAVVDQFRAERSLAGLWPVTVTAGMQVSQDGRTFHVPKKELVGTLQVLLQCRRLTIAAGLAE